MYWDINKALSYQCLFNFVVGARGVGKTYGAKKWAIKSFLKSGKQFVYVRRYREELKKIKLFFDDIADEFPDAKFKVAPPNFIINDKIAGNCMSLSTAKIEKSTPYPKVDKIIFDEFILDKGFHRYLPDEVTNFLELYNTVSRYRDVTVFFLSNALTVTNPYFMYFDIALPYGKNIKASGDILIEMVKDAEFEEKVKESRFAKLVAGTPYANYAIDNDFLRDDKKFIAKKTDRARYVFTLAYKGEMYGVWIDYNAGLEYISKDVDKSCKVTYSVTLEDHSPNMMLLKGKKSCLVEQFVKYYKLGLVRFETMNIKNMCKEIIKMTL